MIHGPLTAVAFAARRADNQHRAEAKMRRVLRFLKWLLILVVLAIGVLAAFLYAAPPALIRVGSAYSAKIVCSNVFIAKRDAQEVLKIDVQAPGHPLLRLMKVSVDAAKGEVEAGLLGLFGKNRAVHREGLGCANVTEGGRLAPMDAPLTPAAPANVSALWPEGEAAAASQNPSIAAVLDDPALQGPGMRAIIAVQNGRIIGERYGKGFDAKTPLLGWSMTKTVNAAILGTLVRNGKLTLDKSDLFPGWAGDGRRAISVGELMGMSSGLAFNEEYGDVTDVTRMLFLEPDMANFALKKPLDAKSGLKFNYSSGTAVLLSRIWQNALGGNAGSYPAKALFKPLGMASAVMEADASGTFAGSTYLYATGRDWARFGEFLRLDGVWNGQALLPPGFGAMMRESVAVSDTGFGPQYGKGQLWLRGPEAGTQAGFDPDAGFDLPDDTFWMLGHDGQSTAIVPSKGLVVVRMGLTPSKLKYKPQGLAAALVKALP
jgi:CubicO group peptidase (beta-lactamase class C family)